LRRSAEELPIPIAAVTGCKPGPRSLQHLTCGNLNAACRWGGVFVCASPRLRGKASLVGRRTCLYEVRVGVLPRGSRKLRGPRIHMRARDIPCESLRVLRCKTAGAMYAPSFVINPRKHKQHLQFPALGSLAPKRSISKRGLDPVGAPSWPGQSRRNLRSGPSVCRDVGRVPTSSSTPPDTCPRHRFCGHE
jgi:hypothetical protein